MKKFINTKGSVWRKWDLHLHTPGTALNDQFNSDWEGFLSRIENLEDLSVLGITDYLSVNNYFKVKDEKLKNSRLGNIDLILPNIELRLTDYTDRERAVNYHVIFSPEIDQYIVSKFLQNLKFDFKGRSYTATYNDLLELGKQTLPEASDELAYVEGVNQFKVSVNDIHKILEQDEKSIFSGKYIAGAANKQGDGISGIRHDQFKAVKENIYQKCDFIFSSNPKDREYFLRQNKALGTPKPCIHGSDAHQLDKVGKPDLNRHTWIKSDPTFEGLLQILTEPDGRVRIQEDNPDKKIDHNIIDKVVFKDPDNFQSNFIELNPDLNTIIGGKSSGKSLLLYKIASTVSPEEVALRTKNKVWNNSYEDTFIDKVEFEVHWRNGMISSSEDFARQGKVTYIPQLYINALSEDTANEVLQEKIWEIILSDSVISEFHQSYFSNLDLYKTNINTLSYKLHEELSKQVQIKSKIQSFEDLTFYETEKNKLVHELEALKVKSKFSPEDEKESRLIECNLVDFHGLESTSLNQINECGEFINVIIDLRQSIKQHFLKLEVLKDPKLVSLYNDFESIINIEFSKFESEVQEFKQKSQKSQTDLSKQIIDYKSRLTEIQSKYSFSERTEILQEEISEFEKKIMFLKKLKDEHRISLEFSDKYMKDLNASLEKLIATQLKFVDLINSQQAGALKVKSKVSFNYNKFENTVIDNFNLRRNLSTSIPLEIIDDNRQFIFDLSDYSVKIKKLLNLIIELPADRFKNNYSLVRIIEDLYRPYTEIILDVEKDNDNISQMSPGKRGLVLLELFLSISTEKHPILIDQPEDNLDNRTISKDLVKFIRNKSIDRQIILVTHNANLVVLTDSNNVIVANQDPSIIENNEARFEYLTGSLECNFEIEGEKIDCQGIRNHACLILEGGQEAFELRELKYGF
ncbi:TrlF family AAA-like ATPase [Exiguobacterium sp. s22]|uniref:TrlF family AAA-like ATPase n=1 Tax=Exiguobacterium sp. s22 TaxID=2751272 RepID=UPI001BECD676|nr:hypothetical protein [Exiguobacterium sp. s22]